MAKDLVRAIHKFDDLDRQKRSAEDLAAVRAGLADGTIDAIATDHAPHHIDEKNVEFAIAMNGIVGLETALIGVGILVGSLAHTVAGAIFETAGINILVCGACLTHLNLMDEKAVGQTTNMLDIVTSMQYADKVINL